MFQFMPSMVNPFRIFATILLLVVGCTDFSERDAESLVRSYNERLMEAYRAGDAEIMEGLVGDAEAKKLTGLIGVKLDMGITLDAELQEFLVLGVERKNDSIDILTQERWYYRDRRVGSGEPVGPDSTDDYHLRYVLRKLNDTAWVVDAVHFESPPQVGREQVLNQAPAPIFHGIVEEGVPDADGRGEDAVTEGEGQ